MASSESLFEHQRQARAAADAPLADRMRPRSFDEFVGQEHIVGADRVLRPVRLEMRRAFLYCRPACGRRR